MKTNSMSMRLRQGVLIIGDLVILYGSLIATLLIRYGTLEEYFEIHVAPFTALFGIWMVISYIIGLYEVRSLKNNQEFVQKFATMLVVQVIAGMAFFYIFPAGITPKTNLSIFILFSGAFMYGWRAFYNRILALRAPSKRLLMVGYNESAEEIARHLEHNPQLGLEIVFWIKEGLQDKNFKDLTAIITDNRIDMVVVPAHIKKNSKAAKLIYKNLLLDIEVVGLANLYETVFKKVPIPELEEVWFLENIGRSHPIYEAIKRPTEAGLAAFFLIVTLPLSILIAVLIVFTSRGPALFSQQRIGKGNNVFKIYKFRTMRADAEKDGPRWAHAGDARVTHVGKLLRHTHLDELPQLWNVVKGDLALIGPRPERPEFTTILQKEIPFYALRHLTRPGVTGWAQVNYRYGASVEDAYEKLQYELYYLKNRSAVLDLLIVLKTIKFFFTNLA